MSDVAHLPEPPSIDALRAAYALDRTRPTVRMNFVTSVDGAVDVDGHSAGLSSAMDKQVFFVLRAYADAVMVGAGTMRHEGYGPVRASDAALDWRRANGLPDHPTLVVVSGSLHFDPEARVFAEAPVRPIVLTNLSSPADHRNRLAPVADVIAVGDTTTDLVAGVAELHRRGLRQILCEGGPHLLGSMLAADLVDEMCLTISPMLVGPGPGRIVTGDGPDQPVGMRLVHAIVVGDEILTRYARSTA